MITLVILGVVVGLFVLMFVVAWWAMRGRTD